MKTLGSFSITIVNPRPRQVFSLESFSEQASPADCKPQRIILSKKKFTSKSNVYRNCKKNNIALVRKPVSREGRNSYINVILTNGKFSKNTKGKKTDVLDCIWIQKLHTLGLLSGSFLPDIRNVCLISLELDTDNFSRKIFKLVN